jgi:hypothetical protein
MVNRKPPRAYDRYEYYWAITWRGALTMTAPTATPFSPWRDRPAGCSQGGPLSFVSILSLGG